MSISIWVAKRLIRVVYSGGNLYDFIDPFSSYFLIYGALLNDLFLELLLLWLASYTSIVFLTISVGTGVLYYLS